MKLIWLIISFLLVLSFFPTDAVEKKQKSPWTNIKAGHRKRSVDQARVHNKIRRVINEANTGYDAVQNIKTPSLPLANKWDWSRNQLLNLSPKTIGNRPHNKVEKVLTHRQKEISHTQKNKDLDERNVFWGWRENGTWCAKHSECKSGVCNSENECQCTDRNFRRLLNQELLEDNAFIGGRDVNESEDNTGTVFIPENDLAVITMDYEDLGQNMIKFSGATSVAMGGTPATFIADIKLTDEGKNIDGQRVFTARKLSPLEAKVRFEGAYGEERYPLFVLHGYNTEPGYHLTETFCRIEEFEKYVPIPVVWPSAGSAFSYLTDQENARKAANNLKESFKGSNVFENKSLLAHSMGNYVMQYAADSSTKFDNIFMVAADVDEDIFDTYTNGNGKDSYGLEIKNMLSKDPSGKFRGKIYVLHNSEDWALNFSDMGAVNNKYRLGQYGAGYNCLHENIQGHIENKDCEPELKKMDTVGDKECLADDNKNRKVSVTDHGYLLYDFAIEFYESKFPITES